MRDITNNNQDIYPQLSIPMMIYIANNNQIPSQEFINTQITNL